LGDLGLGYDQQALFLSLIGAYLVSFNSFDI